MIKRRLQTTVLDRLALFPAVALLGPRQVGKTTLAEDIASDRPSIYLDLESPSDRARLADPVRYLEAHEGKLVVLDEVHRVPELFQTLRGLIDQGRRRGHKVGRFLLLGSASMDLLRQSGESLAGRIAYVDLPPLGVLEVAAEDREKLWVRGGFPDSFLADGDEHSMMWRDYFIKTYLERDIPDLGPRIPAETLHRFWTMLAHSQGSVINAAQLACSLAVDGKTIARYLDLMVDLLLVRRLRPYHTNTKKRLVKSPKVYVRDSGVTHALLGIPGREALFGHPVAGMSWEGFVIDNLIATAPESTLASFYRTSAGAEIDLVLEFPGLTERWAIEIKSGLSAKPKRGFYNAVEDITPERSFVVYAGEERYPVSEGVEAISVSAIAQMLLEKRSAQ
ncbi:MAG TPA: ATP-binding protein [Gammaproteobacteria bacterium]|nr:ATP-binding protein [Gammaproteobacteria bacterium]